MVDTNGLAHVRILDENREVGRTNATGRLLVPDLRSLDINRLAIDAADPQDITADIATREVRPQDGSGIVVRFPVRVNLLPVRVAGAACSLAQPSNMTPGIYTGTQSNAGTMNLTVACTLFSTNPYHRHQ